MKALVVYDTAYGNTEKIAKAVGEAIGDGAKVLRVNEVSPSELESLDVLIVGSPTYGGRPMPTMREFLKNIGPGVVNGVTVAAFDTRMSMKIAKIFGYAAGRIANSLKKKGGKVVGSPEGFIVTTGRGPLKDGEMERAADWAKGIIETVK